MLAVAVRLSATHRLSQPERARDSSWSGRWHAARRCQRQGFAGCSFDAVLNEKRAPKKKVRPEIP